MKRKEKKLKKKKKKKKERKKQRKKFTFLKSVKSLEMFDE